MGHLNYEEGKKRFLFVIILLGVITIGEVMIALMGKGYIIEGMHWPVWLMGLIMIALSLTKAYYVVYEFMHMKYEVSGLRLSVLLPTLLLVWAVIAFFQEGSSWGARRQQILDKDKLEIKYDSNKLNMQKEKETKRLK